MNAERHDQRMLGDSLRLGKQFADFLRREGIDDAARLAKPGMMRGETGDHVRRQLQLARPAVVVVGGLLVGPGLGELSGGKWMV